MIFKLKNKSMSYVKIVSKQEEITEHDNILSFFNSMSSSVYFPKSFNIKTTGTNKAGVSNYELQILTVGREDGSGKSFIFTATGYIKTGAGHRVPLADEIKGWIKFN